MLSSSFASLGNSPFQGEVAAPLNDDAKLPFLEAARYRACAARAAQTGAKREPDRAKHQKRLVTSTE